MIAKSDIGFLNIATLNLNGLKGKKIEIIRFAEDHSLDIFLLQETWLKGERFSCPNYTIFRDDRTNRPLGGTMILVKKNVKAYASPNPDVTGSIEGTYVTIVLKGGRKLRVGSVYCGPGRPIHPDSLNHIFNNDLTTVIGGDLNAKARQWGCRITNPKGLLLLNSSFNYNYHVIAPAEPTHLDVRGLPEILDVFVVKNTDRLSDPIVFHDLTSDHLPVVMEYGDPRERGQGFISKTITNWVDFQELVGNMDPLPPIEDVRTLEQSVATLTENINVSIAMTSATKTTRITKYPNFSRQLKEEIREKNRLKRLAYRTGNPDIKRQANQAAQRVRQRLGDLQSESWSAKIETLDQDENGVFRMARSLTRGSRVNMSYLLDANDEPVVLPGDKAELLADSLSQQFSENPTTDPARDVRIARTICIYKSIPLQHNNFPPITLADIQGIIKQLNIKKAPGLDRIPNAAIKKLSENRVQDIVNIANAVLAIGHFPREWKKAKVILIHKTKEDKRQPKSYRPISLLSNLGKVVEKAVLHKLDDFLMEREILPKEQFGFVAGLGTVQQTTRLATNILKGFNRKHSTGAIFLDVSKAFDRVWHNALIIKLIRLGIPNYLVRFVASFLYNRLFVTEVEGELSTQRVMRAGVPQGSPLSPTLFNLYTNDIPRSPRTQLYLFADDTAITSTAKSPRVVVSRLQNHIIQLEQWMAKWKIAVNPAKTQCIYFSKARTKLPTGHIRVGGHQLPWNNNVKYLGLYFDKRLVWRENVRQTLRKSLGALKGLYSLLNHRSKLNTKTKLTLYKVFLRSVLTYGITTWCTLSKTNLGMIQRYQNKILKIIANAPRWAFTRVLHRDFQIETVYDFVTKLNTKYYTKTDNSTNNYITDSHVTSDINDTFKYPRDWPTY